MEKYIEPPDSARTYRGSPRGCINALLFSSLLGWIILVSLGRAVIIQSIAALPSPQTTTTSLFVVIGQAALILIPLIPFALRWRSAPYQKIYQTWTLAAGFILVMLPLQLTEPSDAHIQAVLHILLGLGYCALLWFVSRRFPAASQIKDAGDGRDARSADPLGWILVAVISTAMGIPWLAVGAFGSLLDIFLQFLAALVFGLAGALLLRGFLMPVLRRELTPSFQDYLLGGLGVGGALLILFGGTGFGFNGMQIFLMLALVSLGWAITALAGMNPGIPSLAALIGVTAAWPMMLVDPDELALVVAASPGEILSWAYSAARIAAFIGLGFGLLLYLAAYIPAARRESGAPSAAAQNPRPNWLVPAAGIAAVLVLIGAIAVYLAAGQPGLYGEDLFVILEDQADLTPALAIEDYPDRREYVYQTLVAHANETQADLRAELDARGVDYTPYYLENAIHVRGGPALALWLERRVEVDRVLENPILRPLPELPDPMVGESQAPSTAPWNLTLIGADRVWTELGVTGEGIVIGQSDSGVDGGHPELSQAYRGADGDHDYNWFDPWYSSAEPRDLGGHGTHTLGIALGQTTGVAPGATWFGCVNLARNLGNPAYYLDCMQFMLAPFPIGGDPFTDGAPELGAHVSNNSWGCPELEGCDPASLLPAVQALRTAGIFMEVSAGNDGPFCASLTAPPAIYPPSFTVGAVDRSAELAAFSSLGPVPYPALEANKPDLVAPGVDVLSALPGGTYASLSGTSMAGPHVSGVVALMWSANPALVGDIDATEEILRETAAAYRGSLPDCAGAGDIPSTAFGYGVVDAYAAVSAAIARGE